jgi:hypothetical protein
VAIPARALDGQLEGGTDLLGILDRHLGPKKVPRCCSTGLEQRRREQGAGTESL